MRYLRRTVSTMNTILIVAAIAALCFAIERIAPLIKNRQVRNWWPRVTLLNGGQAAVAYVGSVTWDHWLTGLSLFSLDHLSIPLQILAGYLLITFVYYWWHRGRHEIPFLWRWLHQLHHSPTRMEVLMSFYKHPFEVAVNGVLSSVLLIVVLGLSPEAVAATVALTGLAELFYHWNVRTPVWLGYLIQRPESHRIHHQRERHTNNYSDLPLWDWLFGTFENATGPIVDCGFVKQREQRIKAMLLGRDVNQEVLS